jgi:hypothetical protein
MSEATEPQPSPTGDGRIVLVKALSSLPHDDKYDQIGIDMIERAQIGKQQYGTYLRSHNGRDAAVDVYQEALDGIMYATQLEMEQPGSGAVDLIGLFYRAARLARRFIKTPPAKDEVADIFNREAIEAALGNDATPVVDWEKCLKKYRCFAIDEDGEGYIFEDTPDILRSAWMSGLRRARYVGNFNLNGIAWRATLTERPNQPPVGVTRKTSK